VSIPTKIKFAFGSTAQVKLWFNSNADEMESLLKEWNALLDTLPELLGLPQGCRLNFFVTDNEGDVITLCVIRFLVP
jgi:hypothetical protein